MPAKAIFSKDATVEYRVIPALDGGVQWHWVLFNTLDKVLGGGTARTRGSAGTQARRKARQLHRSIRHVRVAGLLAEAKVRKPIDVKDFISRMGKWMEVAEKSGYKPTADQFWAKASQGEPIFARKIEGFVGDYTLSVFGGTGKAKGGGLLVWVALDYEDNGNRNRIPLHTFLTTEKHLPYLLSSLEMLVNTHGESWGEVDRIVGNMRKAHTGVFVEEATEDTGLPQARLPVNPAKDYIMDIQPWQERFNKWTHGWGGRALLKDDPAMQKSAVWRLRWGFYTCYMELQILVSFGKDGQQVPRRVGLEAEYLKNSVTDYHEVEWLNLNGDSQMNEFADALEPLVKTIDKWHAERNGKDKNEPTHWDFAKLCSNFFIWMTNHPTMKEYT